MTNHSFLKCCFSISIIAIFLLCSCFPEDNHDFPKKVSFSSEGGIETIKGDPGVHLYSIFIYDEKTGDRKAGIYHMDSDTTVKYDWLAVRCKIPYKEAEFIADPNDSKKKRSLEVHLGFGDSWSRMKVTQKGR